MATPARPPSRHIAALFVWAALSIGANAETQAISLPSGFTTELVSSNLTAPTTIAFSPDGRMFIGQKDGRVRIFQNGNLLPADFINISAQVNSNGDRGLVGLAVHPNFPTQPYVYLLYTYDPPGTVADGSGARVARLIRLTADAATNFNTAVANSTLVLLGNNSVAANIGNPSNNDGAPSCENINGYTGYVPDCLPADSPTHTVGTVAFGIDGSLFVGNGDGAHFTYTDRRALRALDVNSLAGKILRIDPQSGLGYADNPFYNGDPSSNQSKVYDLGLRNPFRFTIHPVSGQPYVGDVGWETWEEINQGRGKNFGWPCYEGSDAGSAVQAGYASDSTTTVRCGQLYGEGQAAIQKPLFAYNHNGVGASVQAGAFYTGTAYPAQYRGALFYQDYNNDWIRYLTFSGSEGGGNATRNVLFFDDFNRSTIGSNWSGGYLDGGGTNADLGLASGRVRGLSTALDSTMTYNAVPLPDDQWAQFTVSSLTGSGWSSPRILLRFGPPGMKSGYELTLRRGSGQYTYRIAKWENGNYVSLAEESAPPWGTGDVIRGEIQGSTLRLFKNDVLVLSAIDSTFTAGRAGITLYSSVLSETELDDFSAGGLSGGGGELSATSHDFALDVSPSGGPVQLIAGPDTNLYYVIYNFGTNTSEVRRIRYQSGGNSPPVARATATPTNGPPPLTVNLSSGGSSDPDGDPISYTWSFGDGGTSNQPNPVHTYSSTGTFTAILTVSDNKGASNTAQVTITVGNSRPTATILAPADGSKYNIGNTIVFQGRGTDPDQGTLTGASLSWEFLVHHNEHVHFDFYPRVSGETGSIVAIDHGDDTWIEVCLTVTDNGGLSDTKCVGVFPNGTTITFRTKPTGLQLVYDGISRTTPFSIIAPVGSVREIIAPLTQSGRTFRSWSDGGAATHSIQIGTQSKTYTATYTTR